MYFNILLQNKSVPLIDLQKSSNTVALVESFLGEFKPDDEGTRDSVTLDKSIIKVTVENKEELVGNLQPLKETSINDSRVYLKLESVDSKEIIARKLDITDVYEPEKQSDNGVKETVKEYVAPVLEQLPSSPPPPSLAAPPPPPAKRRVCFLQISTNSIL